MLMVLDSGTSVHGGRSGHLHRYVMVPHDSRVTSILWGTDRACRFGGSRSDASHFGLLVFTRGQKMGGRDFVVSPNHQRGKGDAFVQNSQLIAANKAKTPHNPIRTVPFWMKRRLTKRKLPFCVAVSRFR